MSSLFPHLHPQNGLYDLYGLHDLHCGQEYGVVGDGNDVDNEHDGLFRCPRRPRPHPKDGCQCSRFEVGD